MNPFAKSFFQKYMHAVYMESTQNSCNIQSVFFPQAKTPLFIQANLFLSTKTTTYLVYSSWQSIIRTRHAIAHINLAAGILHCRIQIAASWAEHRRRHSRLTEHRGVGKPELLLLTGNWHHHWTIYSCEWSTRSWTVRTLMHITWIISRTWFLTQVLNVRKSYENPMKLSLIRSKE